MLWFESVPQNSCVVNLIPSAAVVGGGATGRCLGHEGSTLKMD
jgi:hypothetical protein